MAGTSSLSPIVTIGLYRLPLKSLQNPRWWQRVVSHSPHQKREIGADSWARRSPTVSSASPAPKLKPVLLSGQTPRTANSPPNPHPIPLTLQHGLGVGGRHQQSSQQDTQHWKQKVMASYSKNHLNVHTHTHTIYISMYMCTHMYVRAYACIETCKTNFQTHIAPFLCLQLQPHPCCLPESSNVKGSLRSPGLCYSLLLPGTLSFPHPLTLFFLVSLSQISLPAGSFPCSTALISQGP